MRYSLVTVVLAIATFTSDVGLAAEPDAASTSATAAAFSRDVAPILVGTCLECHGAEKKGKLDLRTRATAIKGGENGSAIVPGDADNSLVFDYVSNHEMPPKKPLDAKQIAAIQKWINDGAHYPERPLDPFAITTKERAGYDWWSLRPLIAPKPPHSAELPVAWQQSAIDRFVFAKLNDKDLRPSPPADPRTLIRRASYDLTGLPPTPEEVISFLAACQKETRESGKVGQRAYEALIDRLLASRHYGEHWGRHWLDVVRFGESNGFERNVIITNVWPFRDYVIQSLNDDKPFDHFIQEHLAGDVLGPNDPDVAVGTTFLVCGPYDNVGNQDPVQKAQIRANTIDEMIRATSTAFLGLTVGCSRCHDHKFDPISQRDYYSLYATFAGVSHGARAINVKPSEASRQKIAAIEAQLARVEQRLRKFEPTAFVGKTIVLDDEMRQSADPSQRSVTLLRPQRGHGTNPLGSGRGFRDDPGGVNRTPNLSRSRYRWWDNKPGVDTFSWNPATAGKFRVWLSWGSGMHLHSPVAQYVLDQDGDLSTKTDQKLITTLDQRLFAGGGPDKLPIKALWSGFQDAGVHEFGPKSRILLRCGAQGQAVTADVVVLQQPPADSQAKEGHQTSQPRLRRPVHAKTNSERIPPTRRRFLRFTVSATNSVEPCIDELEVYTVASATTPSRNVAAASAGAKLKSSGDYAGDSKHKLQHINDGRHGNGRSWISNERGRGWVEIEFAREVLIDRVVWGRDREEKFQDRLPIQYSIDVAAMPGKWLTVASSSDRLPHDHTLTVGPILTGLSPEQAKLAAQDSALAVKLRAELHSFEKTTPTPQWWIGQFRQENGPFHVFAGGSPQRKTDVVQPESMKFVTTSVGSYRLENNSPESARRLALAKWIVAADQPLTPRVLANRLWHYHFGTGIVSTPSDFGYMGGRPTHPELLDWLASQLKRHGWRLKPLHTQIMLSQTYRQASTFRPGAAKFDRDSRLLWRFPPRRLSAEEIRDTALSIAGKLDTRMGGPGFRMFRYYQDNVATYYPLDTHGPETYRRAVYHHNARAMHIDLMTEFDAPDCAFATPRRATTTTPLQALSLLNHSFTIDMAASLAQRAARDAGDVRKDQIRRAFALAFARAPIETELIGAENLIKEHGMRAFCRALLNTNEMIYID